MSLVELHGCAARGINTLLEVARLHSLHVREKQRRFGDGYVTMPSEATKDQIMEAIRPIADDPLRPVNSWWTSTSQLVGLSWLATFGV